MNICLLTEYFPQSADLEIKGGVEVCAYNEARELSKYNNITVITSNENGKDDFYIDNIHVICCGNKRNYTQKGSFTKRLNFMHKAYKKIQTLKDIDIIIGYNFITYPVAWKLSQKLDIPVVARYHDVWIGRWVDTIGITGLFGEVMERYFLKQDVDLILPVSDYTRDNLKKYVDEDKLKTVHNIVDFPEVKGEIEYTHPTISCVARLVEYKRVEDLVRAVAIIKEEIPDINCKIIGTGPEEENLKTLVKELDLEDNIEFLGFVEKHEDVMRVVKSSDIFCLPSIVEGFGIVIIEALSLKTPFIAAEIPPVVEASGHKGGLFYEPKNYKQLSANILKLLKDENLYKKLQDEGYAQSQNYTREVIGLKLNNIFKKLEKNQKK